MDQPNEYDDENDQPKIRLSDRRETPLMYLIEQIPLELATDRRFFMLVSNEMLILRLFVIFLRLLLEEGKHCK